jgi:hypothetical protein
MKIVHNLCEKCHTPYEFKEPVRFNGVPVEYVSPYNDKLLCPDCKEKAKCQGYPD